MNHLTLQELLDYTAGGVDPSRRHEIEDHLARCPQCSAQVAFEERMIRGMRSEALAETSSSLSAAIMKRVETEGARERIPRAGLFLSRILLGGAALALTAAALFLPGIILSPSQPSGTGTMSSEFLSSSLNTLSEVLHTLVILITPTTGPNASTMLVSCYALVTLALLWIVDRQFGKRFVERRPR